MSLSCPVKVCLQTPLRMSHNYTNTNTHTNTHTHTKKLDDKFYLNSTWKPCNRCKRVGNDNLGFQKFTSRQKNDVPTPPRRTHSYYQILSFCLTFAEASQAPETKEFWSGPRDTLITSPVWPLKLSTCSPDSTSHRALHVCGVVCNERKT